MRLAAYGLGGDVDLFEFWCPRDQAHGEQRLDLNHPAPARRVGWVIYVVPRGACDLYRTVEALPADGVVQKAITDFDTGPTREVRHPQEIPAQTCPSVLQPSVPGAVRDKPVSHPQRTLEPSFVNL